MTTIHPSHPHPPTGPPEVATADSVDPDHVPRPPGVLTSTTVEMRKLLTLRGTYLVAGLAVVLSAVVTGLRLGLPGEDPAVEFPTAESRLDILGMPVMLNVLFVALGAMLTAGEWRHRTATPTFLVQPRRWRVVTSQLAVAAFVGTVVAAASAAAVRVTAGVALSLRDAPTDFGSDQWTTMLGVVLAGTLGAALGAGCGAIFRNPALAAVVVAAGGTIVGLVASILSEGLGEALSVPVALGRLVGDEGHGPLQLAGVLGLAGWTAAAAILGIRRTAAADIT
jgi:ABC-2 type transport system permease protein